MEPGRALRGTGPINARQRLPHQGNEAREAQKIYALRIQIEGGAQEESHTQVSFFTEN